jgi:hypothetical protein
LFAQKEVKKVVYVKELEKTLFANKKVKKLDMVVGGRGPASDLMKYFQ